MNGDAMKTAELIVGYLQGRALTQDERRFLRAHISPAQLEALATGPLGYNGRSRLLFKLFNVLFANRRRVQKRKSFSPHPRTMFEQLRPLKANAEPIVFSGGGVNGTGKKR